MNLRIHPGASTGVTKPKVDKRETEIQLIVPFQCMQGLMPLGIGNETHCLNNGGDTEPIQIVNHISQRAYLLFKRRLRHQSFHTEERKRIAFHYAGITSVLVFLKHSARQHWEPESTNSQRVHTQFI
jgi:hypothetical protein